MGVRGLWSYVQSNSSLGTPAVLRGANPNPSKIPAVVDGNGFLYNAYEEGRLDWVCGGQFPQLAAFLCEKVSLLQTAGFDLIFYFDGSLPPPKTITRFCRDNKKIKSMAAALKNLDYNRSRHHAGSFVLPLFALEVAIRTLRSLKVEVRICAGEADDVVANEAARRKAYVIAQDSDYLIHPAMANGPLGYIPLEALRIDKRVIGKDASNKLVYGIEQVVATIYTPKRLAAHFGVSVQSLPLLGPLVGNDYIPESLFLDQIYSWTSWCPPGADVSLPPQTCQHSRIKAAAIVLKGFKHLTHPAHVIERIMSVRIDSGYSADGNLGTTNLTELLRECVGSDGVCSWTSHSDWVPEAETVTSIALGQLPFNLIDVISYSTMWCRPFMEDVDRQCSWLLSRDIRQWAYSVLRERLMSAQDENGEASLPIPHVIEYMRRGERIAPETILPLTPQEVKDAIESVLVSSSSSTAMDFTSSFPRQVLQLPQDVRLTLYLSLMNSDTPSVRSLHSPSERFLAACVRGLISRISARSTSRVGNYEIAALIGSCIVTQAESSFSCSSSLSATPSRRGVQLAAEFQSLAYSAHMLGRTMMLDFDSGERPGVYVPIGRRGAKCSPTNGPFAFDGIRYHGLTRLCKGGGGMERGLPSLSHRSAFQRIYDAVVLGLEGEFDSVMDVGYGKRVERVSSPSVVKKKRTSNLFDVLSSGCEFDLR